MPRYAVHGMLSVPFSEFVEAKNEKAASRKARQLQKIHKHVVRVRINNVTDEALIDAYFEKLKKGEAL